MEKYLLYPASNNFTIWQKPKHREEFPPLTICIASICEKDKIIGAADRMQTAGDMQFEPPSSKIITLTTSIVAMTSGDTTLDSEIRQGVIREVNKRIELEPKNWWLVSDVALLYQKYYNLARLRRLEHKLLAPFALDSHTFIEKQKDMSKDFADAMSSAITDFQIPTIHTIIAGNDPFGAHIYTVREGEVTCWDSAGFVSVGAGVRHVQSQFMHEQHVPTSLLADTLWLTYHAKRRSEVAPGVGSTTDMFMVGPGLGSFVLLKEAVITELGKMYDETNAKELNVRNEMIAKARHYVEEIQKAATQETTQSTPPSLE